MKEHDKQSWYLARIAFEIARRLTIKNGDMTLESMLLTFEDPETGTEQPGNTQSETVPDDAARKRYLEKSKSAWMAHTGLTSSKMTPEEMERRRAVARERADKLLAKQNPNEPVHQQ